MTVARALPGADLAEAVALLLRARETADAADVGDAVDSIAALAAAVAVPYSAAARHLGVSVPTVEAWVSRGALRGLAGASVRSVSASSLAVALAAVRQVKELNPSQRQLIRVIEDARNADLLRAARAAYEAEAANPTATEITDEELDAL